MTAIKRGRHLDIWVFLAVLLAAALHAVWNAMVKGGGDPLLSITHMAMAGIVFAAIGLAFVPAPAMAAWPWLMLSVVLHTGYRLALVKMYGRGDLGQVYPIARGAAPFMTALVTFLLIGEQLGVAGYAGIIALGVGVALISLKGSRLGGLDTAAVTAALATSAWISAYSFADGHGARVNGSGPSFALWLFFLNCIANLSLGFYWRGREVWTTWTQQWPAATGAAFMSQLAYFIAIWAMTKAPIALVAALRETSVLFGALISIVVLREPFTVWRGLAAASIVAGAMLMRLG